MLRNPGPAPVVAVRVGDARLIRLDAAAAAEVRPGPARPPLIAARFAPDDWALALTDLSPGWADTHLRTAGLFLDTVDGGPAGDPSQSLNLRVLAAADAERVRGWIAEPPLRLALAARAMRHTDAAALPTLLAAVDPGRTTATWPAAYESLPALSDAVRTTIEAQRLAALPALAAHRAWAEERGLVSAAQFAVLGGAAPPTLEAPDDAPVNDAALVERLGEALSSGAFERAAHLAGAAAWRWRDRPDDAAPPALDAVRLSCSALETAAQQALKTGRWLAAESWLRLGAEPCGETEAFRERAAALFRVRGDAAARRGDLSAAASAFRGAFWLAHAPIDRARLADTHAELALLRYGEGDFEAGDAHLEAAREMDSLRPRVLEAIGARPTTDIRARVGIIIIMIGLGIFAVRRLRKVFRPPRRISSRRPSLKGRRGP